MIMPNIPRERLVELKRFAGEIRKETVKEISVFGTGHIGGSLSIADVLAVLYGEEMQVRVDDPRWEGRDWFALSKGHCAPALYATLALKGFFPKEWLATLNQNGTNLPSHADRLQGARRGHHRRFSRPGCLRGRRCGRRDEDERQVQPRVRNRRRR